MSDRGLTAVSNERTSQGGRNVPILFGRWFQGYILVSELSSAILTVIHFKTFIEPLLSGKLYIHISLS